MKKMALVPMKTLEEMNRWKAEYRPQLPVSPQVAKTVQLQHNMQQVLQDTDLSETEKAQRFGETLWKFQGAYDKTKSPRLPVPEPPVPVKPLDDRILDSVPSTLRRKAKILLQSLQDHPKMSWNDQGEISYRGQKVPGSNIIDLVNDMVRYRKTLSPPTGWQTFAQGLAEANVPQEAIGNRKRWAWMKQPKKEEKVHEDYDEFVDASADASMFTPVKKEKISSASPFDTWTPYDE